MKKKSIFLFIATLITCFNLNTVVIENNSAVIIEVYDAGFKRDSERYEPTILFPQESCELQSDAVFIEVHGLGFKQQYHNLTDQTVIYFNKHRTRIK